MDWITAKSMLKGKESRKVGNNTYARVTEEDAVVVRLHSTDIIVWYADGTIRMSDGGWDTVTTRARFNEYRPNGYYTHRIKGATYVSRYHEGMHETIRAWTGTFTDDNKETA